MLGVIALQGGLQLSLALYFFTSGPSGLIHRLIEVASLHAAAWQHFRAHQLVQPHELASNELASSRHTTIEGANSCGRGRGLEGWGGGDHEVQDGGGRGGRGWRGGWWKGAEGAEGVGGGGCAGGTWKEEMERAMKGANVYEKKLRGVKLAFAPGDARAVNGRVKQHVRWAAPESSSSSSGDSDDAVGHDPESRAAITAELARDQSRSNLVRAFEQVDCGFQAARVLATMCEKPCYASIFPPDGIHACALQLKGGGDMGEIEEWGAGGGRGGGGRWGDEAEVGSGEYQANLLRVLARVCRLNAQAAQRVSKMQWLAGKLNRILAAVGSSIPIRPWKMRRCVCHVAGGEASRMIKVLLTNCRVCVNLFWAQERGVLGLLWRQLLCPQAKKQ